MALRNLNHFQFHAGVLRPHGDPRHDSGYMDRQVRSQSDEGLVNERNDQLAYGLADMARLGIRSRRDLDTIANEATRASIEEGSHGSWYDHTAVFARDNLREADYAERAIQERGLTAGLKRVPKDWHERLRDTTDFAHVHEHYKKLGWGDPG